MLISKTGIMETKAYGVAEKLVHEYKENYSDGVTILSRKTPATARFKKVNVYVDGVLTSMSEDLLNHLIDIGFYIVVGRRP